MSKKNWETTASIYDQASSLKPEDQLNFVEKKAAGNNDVVNQVMKMLASKNSDFMGQYPGKFTASALDLNQPQTLGNFKVIKKIATGGMGRVYLAESISADVPIKVALKTIRVELINQELKNKFQNEKQVLSRLQHKNIASLVDAGITDNNIPYMATQWIDGQNIKQYCIDGKTGLKDRLKLFLQICDAVAFAHNNLIIHRDLKPDNILVDKQHQVMLLDFGIAKIVDDNQNQQTQTQVYTPDYAAPEQVNGEACTVSTDIYSLGVVLFEILTNTKRFDLSDLSLAEKIKAISSPTLIDINSFSLSHPLPYSRTKITGPLENIINKAMHVDPDRRYDSVFSLAHDVNNYLIQKPISAIKDSFFYKAKMFFLRNKLASTLTSLVFMTVAVAAFIYQQQVSLKLKEAQKSIAMLDLLNNILVSASPSQGGSTNISVKEMFETGISKYNLDDIKDPYIKAELAANIGLIYGQIGNMDKELEYTNIAIDYFETRLTEKQEINSFVNYSTSLGEAFTDAHEYDTALNHIQNVLNKVTDFEVDKIVMGRTYIVLARIYKGKKNDDNARRYLDKAAILANATDDHMQIGLVNFYQYSLFFDSISDQQALFYLEQAQTNFELASQSKFNPNLESSISSRADLLSTMGRFEASEKLHIQANELTFETYGRGNFIGLISRAKNLNKLGRFQQSIKLLDEAKQVYQDLNLSREPAYHGMLSYTADAYVELQKFDQAEVLFKTTLNFFSSILPTDHHILKSINNDLADLYLKSATNVEIELAEIQLKSYIESDSLEQNLPKHVKITTLINLGNISLYHKDYSQARAYFTDANTLAATTREKYDQGWLYWQLQTGLAMSEIKLGELSATEQFHTAKQLLLDKVSEDQWYDLFYAIK